MPPAGAVVVTVTVTRGSSGGRVTTTNCWYGDGRVLHENTASARDCEYVTSATDTRVRNTLQLLAARPPVRRFFLIVIFTAVPLPTATTIASATTTITTTTTADRATDTGKW